MRQFQGQRQPVRALAFAPGGPHLAAGDGKSGLAIYDVTGGGVLHRFPLSHGPADLLTFMPDGRLVAAAEGDMWVYVDPLRSGGCVGFYPHQVGARVTSVAASDSGDRLFATATHLHCWRMGERVPKAGWVVRATEPGLFWAVAASPDGDRLAVTAAPWTRSAELALYDARSGERVAALVPDYFHRGGPLRWSPDGTILAAVAHCDLALFDAAEGRRAWRVRAGGRQAFTALAFHPSGRSLLLGCYDGTARLYDVASGREVRSFAWPLGKVLSVAFAPDGTLAAAGGDKGQVVVWDVDD